MAENLKPRSGVITDGPDRAPSRAMLKAVGFTDEDLRRPIVGVANTWIEIGPCNYHLRRLAAKVKEGIRAAGGTPMEFNTVSISDGISMGAEGMKCSLISREVIADSIELVARGNHFDALVCLSGCDKTNPGVVMALARLDIPGLALYGGSIAPGHLGDKDLTIQDVFEAVGAYAQQTDRRRTISRRGKRRMPRRGRLRRTIYRQHHVDRDGVSRHLADGQQRYSRDRRRKRRSGVQRRQVGDGFAQSAIYGRRGFSRASRSRTRLRRWRPPAVRPTRCCICSRSRAKRASN